MKKSFLTISFLVVISLSVYPQYWFPQNSGVTSMLNSVKFIDSKTGYIGGWFNRILKTTDGGNNWILLSPSPSIECEDLFFINKNLGFAVGQNPYTGLIIKTTDGGISWITRYNSGRPLRSVFFIDKNHGFTVGCAGTILKTTDGGDTWENHSLASTTNLMSVFFTDINNGYITDVGGKIWKSIDNGNNWQIVFSEPNSSPWALNFVNKNVGYVGASHGRILKSTDAGNSWVNKSPITYGSFLSIHFADSLIGIAVHGGGVYGTQDGGETWTWQAFMYVTFLNSCILVNSTTGYVVGYSGVIYKTESGVVPVELSSFKVSSSDNIVNLNWSTASELNNRGFEIERSFDKNEWRIIGYREGNGTTSEPQQYSYSDDISEITASKLYYRLKQIDFNGTFEYSDVVEVEISPRNFSLEQNYPNPFNPSTKISWQSPVGSHQTVEIYDVLGNEVATLIDEFKEAGRYEITFDASNLSSGIYYYQLRAGEFVETKKMILLK